MLIVAIYLLSINQYLAWLYIYALYIEVLFFLLNSFTHSTLNTFVYKTASECFITNCCLKKALPHIYANNVVFASDIITIGSNFLLFSLISGRFTLKGL